MEALIYLSVGAGLVFQYPIQLGVVRKTRQSPAAFELVVICFQQLFSPVNLLVQIFLELSPEIVLRQLTLFVGEIY